MKCPRLDHFTKMNFSGKVCRCANMVHHVSNELLYFDTVELLDQSEWLVGIKEKFSNDVWPDECIKCAEIEKIGGQSIRMNAIDDDKTQTKEDYLIAEVILDNICNSACQFCQPMASTKIGSLYKKDYKKIDNVDRFWAMPTDRLVQIDIIGGEPAASANVRNLLDNLPPNVNNIRFNTNGSMIIKDLDKLANKGIKLNITVSFDGVGKVHDYIRWPMDWDKLLSNILVYRDMKNVTLTLWTTLNALNVNDMENILAVADRYNIDYAYGLLFWPPALNPRYNNVLTSTAKEKLSASSDTRLVQMSSIIATDKNNQEEFDEFVSKQDKLRNISIKDYIKF